MNGIITAQPTLWHRMGIDFNGPVLTETASTFTDYRLTVAFTHVDSGKIYEVPGFFAADGDAADTGATSGTVWRVHFNPPLPGEWEYEASFRAGDDVAVSMSASAGRATAFNGAAGDFEVAVAPAGSTGFRSEGMLLQDPGEQYLSFSGSDRVFVKGGTNSPENFLAYDEFDATWHNASEGSIHDYDPHLRDWRTGDPTWDSGRGKNIIGAVNYLAGEGVNAVYMLAMNVNGDGDDVWPWVSDQSGDRRTFDVSKLAQWEAVFEHMDDKGILIHMVTQEQENDQLLGGLSLERQLYYRELIARFGHHNGLIWNLGEENTNSLAEQKAFARYFENVDPYGHLVNIHTFPDEREEVYDRLLGVTDVDGASLQVTTNVRQEVARWVGESRDAGDAWVVSWDEVGSALNGVLRDGAPGAAEQHTRLRKDMWGALTAGAAGVEWYAGRVDDRSVDDFRVRDSVWTWTNAATDFFERYLPLNEMRQADSVTSGTSGGDYVIAKEGSVYAIYLPRGGTASLDLRSFQGTFDVQWYNPRVGGELKQGTVDDVQGGTIVSLGQAPSSVTADWAILVRRAESGGISGTSGNDTLQGSSGADEISGLAGADTLIGLGGNDRLNGGTGNDLLNGGAGSDSLIGGEGVDTARFSGVRAIYDIRELSGAVEVRDTRSGSPNGLDKLQGVERLQFDDLVLEFGSTIVGTAGNDVLVGTSDANRFVIEVSGNGNSGRDTLRRFEAADVLVTNERLLDTNDDGRVRADQGDRFSWADEAFGGTMKLFGLSGKALSTLVLQDVIVEAGMTSYVYAMNDAASASASLGFG